MHKLWNFNTFQINHVAKNVLPAQTGIVTLRETTKENTYPAQTGNFLPVAIHIFVGILAQTELCDLML